MSRSIGEAKAVSLTHLANQLHMIDKKKNDYDAHLLPYPLGLLSLLP